MVMERGNQKVKKCHLLINCPFIRSPPPHPSFTMFLLDFHCLLLDIAGDIVIIYTSTIIRSISRSIFLSNSIEWFTSTMCLWVTRSKNPFSQIPRKGNYCLFNTSIVNLLPLPAASVRICPVCKRILFPYLRYDCRRIFWR